MMLERRAKPKPGKCGLEPRAKRSHWTGKVYPPLGFSSSEKSVWLLGTDWPAGGQVGIGRPRRGCRHCALCPACSSPSTPRLACPPADLTSPPRGLRVPERKTCLSLNSCCPPHVCPSHCLPISMNTNSILPTAQAKTLGVILTSFSHPVHLIHQQIPLAPGSQNLTIAHHPAVSPWSPPGQLWQPLPVPNLAPRYAL